MSLPGREGGVPPFWLTFKLFGMKLKAKSSHLHMCATFLFASRLSHCFCTNPPPPPPPRPYVPSRICSVPVVVGEQVTNTRAALAPLDYISLSDTLFPLLYGRGHFLCLRNRELWISVYRTTCLKNRSLRR